MPKWGSHPSCSALALHDLAWHGSVPCISNVLSALELFCLKHFPDGWLIASGDTEMLFRWFLTPQSLPSNKSYNSSKVIVYKADPVDRQLPLLFTTPLITDYVLLVVVFCWWADCLIGCFPFCHHLRFIALLPTFVCYSGCLSPLLILITSLLFLPLPCFLLFFLALPKWLLLYVTTPSKYVFPSSSQIMVLGWTLKIVLYSVDYFKNIK